VEKGLLLSLAQTQNVVATTAARWYAFKPFEMPSAMIASFQGFAFTISLSLMW
jgi:hypothetical protein